MQQLSGSRAHAVSGHHDWMPWKNCCVTRTQANVDNSKEDQMDKYGKVLAPDTVRFERLLPGPIERVWSYLTDPEKRSKWLAGGPMELRIGGPVKLWFHHKSLDTLPDEAPPRYK